MGLESKGMGEKKNYPLSRFPFSDLLSRFYLNRSMFHFTLLSVKDIMTRLALKTKNKQYLSKRTRVIFKAHLQ